ncbi:restriction endonuclease subunit S [Niabella ginsengisoli]|uniref:Restriction endonuclease subunit S n=1 Tax=Niabella ginsengisoli TaxID=522298 RepID=A0ABS9SIS4_9BACT|nr:restriction endonuclease subunit S [Niabella ginsengisoli]MCH5598250.1 restriction endonuclease subunit S [Niabella ginsengisoli]
MQRYEKYKDSGVNWIGEIPEHWEVVKLKFLGKAIIGLTYSPNDLCSENEGTLVLRSSNLLNGRFVYGEKENSYVSSKIPEKLKIRKNDILICSRNGSRDLIGKCAIATANDEGNSFGAFTTVFRSDLNNYLFKILNSNIFKNLSGSFLTSTINQLTIGNLNSISVPIPPLPEQQTIATFLDDKTTKIDQTITIKEKEIELLKERRQILIQKAVTKGLNQDAPDLRMDRISDGENNPEILKSSKSRFRQMKDSGVDWIGEIPEHWEVRKLKYFIQNLEGGVSVNASESESAEADDFGVLKTSCVYNYYFEAKENKKVFENEKGRVSCQVRKGAIIISRMNAPELVGASGLVLEEYPNLFLPDRLWQTVYRNNISFDPVWLSKILINKGFRNYMTTFANGSSPSMKNISKGDFLNITVPFSPKSEQTQIVSYLEEIEEKIAKAISLKEQEIEKLKEYKTVLIDNVVTGKVKVV